MKEYCQNSLVKPCTSRHIEIMRFGLGILLSLGLSASALAAPWDIVPASQSETQTPAPRAPLSMQRGGSADKLATIDSLTLTPFAKGLGTISAMAVSDNGTLFAADIKSGRIWALSDRGADGAMDIKRPLPITFDAPTGLALIGQTLYVADKRAVWALDLDQGPAPRRLASLANAKSQGFVPLSPDGESLILGITQESAAIIVRVNTASGQAEKIGEANGPIHSLAKRRSAPLWLGAGAGLHSIDSPQTALSFSGQTVASLMLPGQYSTPEDWPVNLNDMILAAQTGPKAMQIIAVPTEFGQPSAPPRILVDGFLSSTGRSAWGKPGAMVMDKRGLFFADSYNGVIWRLSAKPKTLDPAAEIKKIVEDTPKTVETIPTKSPLLIGSGIKGSQLGEASLLGEASQLETGSTILDAYEKAEAEKAEAEKKAQKIKKSKKTYRSRR